jgi:hypothetical protein
VVEFEAPPHLGPEVEGEELGKADFVDEEDDQEQGENIWKKLRSVSGSLCVFGEEEPAEFHERAKNNIDIKIVMNIIWISNMKL